MAKYEADIEHGRLVVRSDGAVELNGHLVCSGTGCSIGNWRRHILELAWKLQDQWKRDQAIAPIPDGWEVDWENKGLVCGGSAAWVTDDWRVGISSCHPVKVEVIECLLRLHRMVSKEDA